MIEGRGTASDIENLKRMAKNMSGTSICALCDGAAMPLRSFVAKFEHEFQAYVQSSRAQVSTQQPSASFSKA
jgi:NADH-quinone oxidoreductase subunit F